MAILWVSSSASSLGIADLSVTTSELRSGVVSLAHLRAPSGREPWLRQEHRRLLVCWQPQWVRRRSLAGSQFLRGTPSRTVDESTVILGSNESSVGLNETLRDYLCVVVLGSAFAMLALASTAYLEGGAARLDCIFDNLWTVACDPPEYTSLERAMGAIGLTTGAWLGWWSSRLLSQWGHFGLGASFGVTAQGSLSLPVGGIPGCGCAQ